MTRNPDLIEWHPASWQSKPAQQQATYRDPAALQRTIASLARLPPLVVSWEIEALREHIAAAQRGERFILQGGDCAESFEDCESDKIAKKLKILLQMSLVLVYGLRKPVVRIGRMAGQYAKPRSADTETRDGQTLPSYRGDIINRPGFTLQERDPDPELLLRGYERAALTLNFVRALIDGGFADLHHPEYWDLDFVRHSPLKEAYERIVQSISDSLDFFEATSRAPIHEANRVAFYTSHEGLHLPYEQAQTRFIERQRRWYNLSTHMPWIGMRTAALDGAHVEFFRGISNPVGIKVGPSMSAEWVQGLIAALNPRNEPGRLVLIHRMGIKDIDKRLRAAGSSSARDRQSGAVDLRSDARQYRDRELGTEDATLREHRRGGRGSVPHSPRAGLVARRRALRADRRGRDGVHRWRPRAHRWRLGARVQVAGRSATELRAGAGARDAHRRLAREQEETRSVLTDSEGC